MRSCVVVALTFVAVGLAGTVVADQVSPQAAYDLQERCGRAAREWFRAFFGNGQSQTRDGPQTSNYTNHYSASLGRCYAVVTSLLSIKDKKTGAASLTQAQTLVDVNENKTLGTYFKFIDHSQPPMCGVQGVGCTTDDEWTNLLKPYMER
jgi:hypothetical protein